MSAQIEHLIPEDSPFSLCLDYSKLDIQRLRRAFSNAPTIEIVAPTRSGAPPLSTTFAGNMTSNPAMMSYMMDEAESVVTLKVTKVGILNRRDESYEGSSKKSSKKWKQWGLILTSAQLLFFKDTIWTGALQSQIADQAGDAQLKDDPANIIITPRITYFRPDAVISLSDAIAVLDDGCVSHPYAFRLYANQAGQVRQYMIQAHSQEEMLDWMTKINYCGAFRSVGIRRLDAFSAEERMSLQRMRSGISAASSASNPTASGSSSASSSSANLASATNSRVGALVAESNIQILRRLEERVEEVEPKLNQLDESLHMLLQELEEHLRLARHFSIMTPFQKTTRERIEIAAVPLGIRVRKLRLEAIKAEARRAILAKDCEQAKKLSRSSSPALGVSSDRAPGDAEAKERSKGTRYLNPNSVQPGGTLQIDTTAVPRYAGSQPLVPVDELTPVYRSSQESDEKVGEGAAALDVPLRAGLPSRTTDGGPPLTPQWAGRSPADSIATPATPASEVSADASTLQHAETESSAGPAGRTSSGSEEAADWHATAAAPEKRVSLATLPSISADDMETLTRAHKLGMKRIPTRTSLSQVLFTPPNVNLDDPGPFG